MKRGGSVHTIETACAYIIHWCCDHDMRSGGGAVTKLVPNPKIHKLRRKEEARMETSRLAQTSQIISSFILLLPSNIGSYTSSVESLFLPGKLRSSHTEPTIPIPSLSYQTFRRCDISIWETLLFDNCHNHVTYHVDQATRSRIAFS